MRRLALLCLVVAGCAREPASDGARTPPTTPAPGVGAPPPRAATTPTRVELTSVTLADDCGGAPPSAPPVRIAKADSAGAEAERDWGGAQEAKRASRRCEQTSMQLAILAGDASKLQVKSVELFDDAGTSLGTLTASKPTRWSDANGLYEAWDEQVPAGSSASISYVLSQPPWDRIDNRLNRTYRLKVVLSVGGVDQTTHKDVTLSAPTSLPPDVET